MIDKKTVVQHRSSADRLLTLETENKNMKDQIASLCSALDSLADSFRTTLIEMTKSKDSISINTVDVRNLNSLINGIMNTLVKKGVTTLEEIKQYTVENTTKHLTDQLNFMVSEGMLSMIEEIEQDSFVVFEEIDGEGKILSPRVQIAMNTLPPEERSKLLAKKAGETVQIMEGSPEQLRILEVYRPKKIVAPEAE
jgi:hypothetical protein